MQILRIISLLLVAIGVVASLSMPPIVSVVPVPGPDRSVTFIVDVRHAGDYRAFVSSPTSEATAPSQEHVTCRLKISVGQGDGQPVIKTTEALHQYGQTGFMHLDLLNSDAVWRVAKGEAVVHVVGSENCSGILSRGGALSFEEDVMHPTEVYLGNLLKFWAPRDLAVLGLLILFVLEFIGIRKRRIASRIADKAH
jgi:hypothetical protein